MKTKQIIKNKNILAAFGGLLLVTLALFSSFRSQPAWIVEDSYVDVWEKVLTDLPSPLKGAKIIPQSTLKGKPPASRYGYFISSVQQPQVSAAAQDIVRVYRGLAGSQQIENVFPLAVDPWLVFRKYTSAPLTREEAEHGPAEGGRILTAGADQAANQAWIAQFLQEAPGVFSSDGELWERTGARLFLERRFQSGAMTYSWNELWPHLLADNETVWIYAPLSRIRRLPLYESNSLAADIFPGRPGWNDFGLQAEIIWAIPYGSEKNQEKLEAAGTWLHSAEVQSLLADTLGWLAAHPEAPPYNPVSLSARTYWFTASYVWEMAEMHD